MLRRISAAVLACSSIALAEVPARLLVLSKAESKLAIIDPATLKVIASVPTGHAPHEVCVSAGGKTAFVSDYGSAVPGNTLTVIDLESARAVKTVDLSPLRRPHGIGEFAGKIYFTAEVNAAIGRYDPKEDKLDLIVGTGQQGSHMLAIDPADGRVYTTNLGSDSVSAIDPQRGPGGNPLTSHVAVAGQPEGIALAPDGRELWAGPRVAGQPIAVIETSGDTVVKTIPFDGVAIRLTFTPDGSSVLVSDAKNHELVVFDAKTKEKRGAVKVGEVPVGCVVQPDGARAFVSCTAAHKVVVVDLKEMNVTGEIDAGPAPDGIAWAAARTPVPQRRPGMLGAQLENLGGADVEKYKLASQMGVLVVQPMPGSAAEAGGLKTGDVILTVNGAAVANVQQFVQKLSRAAAGDSLAFNVRRDGQDQEVKVTLAPRPG